MTKKLKAACGTCAFVGETGEEMLLHMMTTGHGVPAEFKEALQDGGAFQEVANVLERLLWGGEGLDIQPVSEEDVPEEIRNRVREIPMDEAPECPICHARLNHSTRMDNNPGAVGDAAEVLHFCHHCTALLLQVSPTQLVPAPQSIVDDPEVQRLYQEALEIHAKANLRKKVVGS